jgi:ubiquinone/menaquinone biosynthesis C-methylase UbiE
MLQSCKKLLKGNNFVKIIQSSAEKSGLPDLYVDYITVAQAFHLFKCRESLVEFKRILRPDAILILIWNSQEHDNELFHEREAVIKKYCPNYQKEIHAQSFSQNSFCHCFSKNSYIFKRFFQDATEYLDETTFIMRTLSASYAITQENSDYDFFKQELSCVFNHHSQDGFVEVPQSTIIYHGRIN